MLDTVTVGAIAGGQWSSAPVPSETCAAPRPGTTATTRTAALTSGSSILIQTVSVHQNAEDAEAAVSAGAKRLTACGWTAEDTDLVGEAAVQLRRGTGAGVQRVVLVALEGVTAALVATGRELAAPGKMSALVDVAVNSSCAAAADGCH